LPTAQKLAQVIELIEKKTNQTVSNIELATYTGLSLATVGRCKKLLTLSKKFQDVLIEEEKLAEKGIKPSKTALTEDFLLEMLRGISAIESRKAGLQKLYNRYGKDQIISCFVEKFKSGNIPNITDFRYLSKLVKQTKIPLEKRERVLTRILNEPEYRIDMAYDVYARPFYESEGLGKQLEKIEMILESLEISSLDRGSGIVFLNSLENFRKIVQDKIAELKENLGEKTEGAK
jgi:hypothetical protein